MLINEAVDPYWPKHLQIKGPRVMSGEKYVLEIHGASSKMNTRQLLIIFWIPSIVCISPLDVSLLRYLQYISYTHLSRIMVVSVCDRLVTLSSLYHVTLASASLTSHSNSHASFSRVSMSLSGLTKSYSGSAKPQIDPINGNLFVLHKLEAGLSF